MVKNLKKEISEILDVVRRPPGERRRVSPKDFEKVIASIQASNDEHVIKLFENVNESYRDPWAWYALIGVLAQALFESHKRGRRPKYDKPSDAILKQDYRKVAKANGGKAKATEICRQMIERHPRKYGPVELNTLNTWVSKAGAVKEFKNTRRRTTSKTSLKK